MIMGKKVSLILPTYNEKENIAELIRLTIALVPELHEIIVVDDNSPDGTAEIVAKLAAKNKKIKIIKRIHERGLASAISRGIKESTGNIIGWMDADLSMPASSIPSLLAQIPQHDIAIGSRYVSGGKDIRQPLRVLTSKAINVYTNLLLGFTIKDYNSGFVFAKRNVFEKVTFMEKGYGQYCIRFLHDCLKKEFTIKEIGYPFTDRVSGERQTGETALTLLKHGWNYGTELIKIRLGR